MGKKCIHSKIVRTFLHLREENTSISLNRPYRSQRPQKRPKAAFEVLQYFPSYHKVIKKGVYYENTCIFYIVCMLLSTLEYVFFALIMQIFAL